MDKKVDWSDAAFPSAFETQSSDGEITNHFVKGLSKREYFAAVAMQAIITTNYYQGNLADIAVDFADGLIKSLEKPSKEEAS